MSGARECPELAPAFEYPRSLQLVTGDLGEVTIKLQNFPRLHGVVALGNHRQRCFGVRTVEHLLLGEGVDGAEMADSVGFEVNGAFLDRPVHSGLALPDFDGLFLRELIT
ncbi:hypothetical protein D3C84_835690 [compost metagenome]